MTDKNLVICRGYVPHYIESKKLLFYHIPKSAGTSICNILSTLIDNSFPVYGVASCATDPYNGNILSVSYTHLRAHET